MEATAQMLLSNAPQLLSEEYRKLRSVGGDVAELRDDLDTMTALLVMQSEAEDGAVDHFVRVWMKQLREVAYDAEDCIDLYRLRIKSRPGTGTRAWLERLLGTLLPRRRLAANVRALRTRAVAISERHARYGVNRDALRRRAPAFLASAAPASSAHALRPASDGDDDPERRRHLVGIEEQASALATGLEARDADGDARLRVFSIVGFGGLGKTTLAMEVCRRLDGKFPCQALASVSQAFQPGRDLKPLLKRVLQQVFKVKTREDIAAGTTAAASLGDLDAMDDNQLAEKLKEFLTGKRYLIVIDDVWTVRAWEAIQSVLPENKCSSRIIVTTRIDTVAQACSPASSGYYIHHMKPLNFEDSRMLFLSRTFGNEEPPLELDDIIKKILKRCSGLPLAIVSIASVLASYTSSGSKDKWESIYNSIGSQMDNNPTLDGMRQIVTLSYYYLPYELKGCMMYLSIFPEDYEINKDRLLCRWIAEGLVMEKRGLTLMEVAESYWDELVSRNLIEVHVDFDYYWKVELCRVHDMLLEVIVPKSLECNFVSLLGGQYASMSYDRIRRLSIQGGDNKKPHGEEPEHPKEKTAAKRGIEGMGVEHIRSLSLFHHGGQKLLDRLKKFNLMRVLDLEGCTGLTKDHMRYICRLYLLRFLSLKNTDITEVPPQIEKLEHLQTIDVCNTPVHGLPETVKKLHKLERLQMSYNSDPKCLWRLPQGLKYMKALREVGFSVIGNDVEAARELGELEELVELVVYTDSQDINGNQNVLNEFARSLSKLYSLRRLVIGDMDYGQTLNFLHCLPAPLRLLRFLMIAGGIDRLPDWIGSLTYLVQFNMSWGKIGGDQLFDVLCELPSLKIISIQQMCYMDDELVARTRHRFPELRELRVAYNYENPDVIRFEEGTMPKLEMLLFNFVGRDKRIDGIEHLTRLKEVQLWGHKNNPALHRQLKELKVENERRLLESSGVFQIVMKYE